jgi:putative ABC transport system substrate-binding protein
VTPDALAAKKATQAIPIVMAAAGDVLVTGLVESLARPGGNITGLSQMNPELVGKRLELPKEIVPSLTRVAVLWNPADMISALTWRQIQLPARSLSIELHSMEVRTSSDIDKAFEGATRARSGAVAIMPSPVFVTNLKRLADLTAKNRLPSIFHVPDFVSAGGLVTYGPDGLLAKPDRPPVLDSRRATPIPIKGVLSASELMGGVLHRQEPVARRAGGREDHQDRGRLGG